MCAFPKTLALGQNGYGTGLQKTTTLLRFAQLPLHFRSALLCSLRPRLRKEREGGRKEEREEERASGGETENAGEGERRREGSVEERE